MCSDGGKGGSGYSGSGKAVGGNVCGDSGGGKGTEVSCYHLSLFLFKTDGMWKQWLCVSLVPPSVMLSGRLCLGLCRLLFTMPDRSLTGRNAGLMLGKLHRKMGLSTRMVLPTQDATRASLLLASVTPVHLVTLCMLPLSSVTGVFPCTIDKLSQHIR